MKIFPFLLLLACLLNTALSHPSGCGCWPFRRRVAVSQSEDSPLEAATEVDPVLPFDILLKIALHADPKTVHHLGAANKALKEELRLKWPTVEQKDVEKIQNSRPLFRPFFRAIIKKDMDAVRVLYPQVYYSDGLEHIYGLELAARYHNPEAGYILLACGKLANLAMLTKAQEKELGKHRIDAERQQNETGLALLALISHEKFTSSHDREFLRSLILQSWSYLHLGLRWGPSKHALLIGLQLAVQCGTNKNIFVLLAFGTCDWDMESEEIKKIIDAAEGRLSQMDLDLLKKIQNSAPEKQLLWKDFVVMGNVHPSIVSDHDTAIVAMQLALMTGRTWTGARLLHKAGPKLKEKLIHAAATLATNADKSDNLQQIWELIEKRVRVLEMEAKMREREVTEMEETEVAETDVTE